MAKRALNSLQKYYYYRSELNLHSCIFLALQLNKLPDKQELARALRKIISQFSEFHCNIFQDGKHGELCIKSIEENSIYFEDVVEYISWREDDSGINNIFQTYKFPYHVEKPLWKILVDSDKRKLILVVNHVLFDGIACVEFWNVFMKILNKEQNKEQNKDGDSFEPLFSPNKILDVVPDIHPYENWPVTWKYKILRPLLGALFRWSPGSINRISPKLFKFKGYTFPEGLMLDSKKNEYEIRNDNCQFALKVPPEKLSNVLKICKSNAVSLTSFLAALFCVTIEETIKNEDYTGSILKVDIPMNTRNTVALRCTSSGNTKIGNFVAPLELQYMLHSANDIWTVAKDFQRKLHLQTVENIDDTIQSVKLLDVVDQAAFVNEKIRCDGPQGTFEITNLGLQPFSIVQGSNCEFEVQDAIFNEPQSCSDIFTCAMVSTPLGGLRCSISYPRDIEVQFLQFAKSLDEYFSTK